MYTTNRLSVKTPRPSNQRGCIFPRPTSQSVASPLLLLLSHGQQSKTNGSLDDQASSVVVVVVVTVRPRQRQRRHYCPKSNPCHLRRRCRRLCFTAVQISARTFFRNLSPLRNLHSAHSSLKSSTSIWGWTDRTCFFGWPAGHQPPPPLREWKVRDATEGLPKIYAQ